MCCRLQSTLMREIANGKVDGFPPKDELRTVYVEHDIDAEQSDVSVAAYVLQDPTLQGEVDEKKVAEALSDVGFTPAMQADRVAALSGGWKMKLALGEPFCQHALFTCHPVDADFQAYNVRPWCLFQDVGSVKGRVVLLLSMLCLPCSARHAVPRPDHAAR